MDSADESTASLSLGAFLSLTGNQQGAHFKKLKTIYSNRGWLSFYAFYD